MKNRLLPSFAALAVLLFLLPLASNAQTPAGSTISAPTVTPLLSQNFSGATFPPTGWSATNTAAGNQTTYAASSVAWYHSTAGNGGTGGGTYGSAVANGMCAYSYLCYDNAPPYTYNGYYIGAITLTGPTVSLASFPAADSQFIDFDAFIPTNAYESGNNANLGSTFTVMNGASSLSSYSVTTFANGTTGNTGITAPSDPANYTASTYWKHFHIAIPKGTSSLSLAFNYNMVYTAGCYYTYFYADNFGVTNVVVSDYHYATMTVNGPTTLNFGTVPFQQPAGPYYCDLTCPGTNSASISLVNYAISGANPGDFTLTRTPASIAVGANDSVGVLYTPQGTGSRSATLTFSLNGTPPGNVTVLLSGTGVAPTVKYSSTAMFRGVSTELTDTSGTQYLYVNSTGAVALTVQSVSIVGLDASAYLITHVPAGSIAAGGVDSIGVRFFPDLEGVPSAQMVIKTNASNLPIDTVKLSGIGILPHLSISSSNAPSVSSASQYLAVSFDSVTMGTDSCLSLVLTNPGSDTVAIESNYFASADPDFSFTPLTGKADTLIAPGGSQMIQVCFNPVGQGYRTATLRIVTSIPPDKTVAALDTNSYAVVFIGTGVPVGHLAITGRSNGTTPITTPACVTDTFWNTGAASLTLDTITFTGANAADFSGTPQVFPVVIQANSFWPYQVCATPHDTGTEIAVLTGVASIGVPALQLATFNLSVYGTKVADTLVVTVPFTTPVCGTDTATITVTNTGNVAAAYQASVAGGTNPADFTVVLPVTSPSESGGGVATFKVAFTPTTAGNETTNFNIAGGGNGTLVLTATGGAATIAGSGTAPNVGVGAPAEIFTAKIDNTGTCPWTPGPAVALSPFTYVGGGTTPIAPGGSTTDTFSLATAVAGNYMNEPVSFPTAVGTSLPAANVTLSGVVFSADVQPISSIGGYSLDQNYPNPFGGESTVDLTLPTGGTVQLNIINVEGQVVESVLDRHFDAGTFEVTLHADALASGTYYYQMTSGGVILTRQMEVIK